MSAFGGKADIDRRCGHVTSYPKRISDQLHVDVVARLDEIVAGWPFGWRQVDHPLDREPRALDDRRLDCDLEALPELRGLAFQSP